MRCQYLLEDTAVDKTHHCDRTPRGSPLRPSPFVRPRVLAAKGPPVGDVVGLPHRGLDVGVAWSRALRMGPPGGWTSYAGSYCGGRGVNDAKWVRTAETRR